jgi:ATP-binding cassette subfamily B protein
VLLTIFFQALNVVGQLVVVVAGGLRVIDGTLELGTFFSFYLYLGLLLGPLMDLPNLFVTGRQAAVCMDRLDEVEAPRPEREGWREGAPDPAGLERLELLGVEVRHGGEDEARPPALRGLGLELRRGEKLAVVGEVGAGKSTLARLVAGACAPSQGQVRWNERPRAEWSRAALRAAIGWVPQEPVLFATTVRENVLMGRPEEPARLRRALEVAGILAEVEALPGGLDQPLGLRGKGLSGGQRQRLGIARALYSDPTLLVLDDVTAALDAENEVRFWRRLAEEWPAATVLVVTHREATARRMDRVVRLEAGSVAGVPA